MLRALTLLLLVLSVSGLNAQRYGHLNFANLLAEMPGTKAAESELEAYNKQLIAKGENMAADLQKRIQEVEAQVNDLPPIELDARRAELVKERDEILRYEQQIAVDLEKKRQELLGPLIEQARQTVEQVAQENGFSLVFDTSIFNAILFAEESEDLMALVRAKLGI